MAQSTHSRCKIIAIFSDNYRRKLLNLGFLRKKMLFFLKLGNENYISICKNLRIFTV